jgi:hypothetical protein
MSEPTIGRDDTTTELETETQHMTEPTTDSTTELTRDETTELARDETAELPTDRREPVLASAPTGPTGPTGPRGPSLPTVIWGVIFGLVAAGVIAAQTSDVDLNLEVTAPTALLVAGVVLVLWGIAGLGRARLRR